MSSVKLLKSYSSRNSNSVYSKNERIATTLTEPPRVSTFNLSRRHLTTFNNSKLVPIFIDEVLPGDTWNISLSALIRMSTPQAPTMENPKVDFAFFFVPNNVIYPEFKYLMGETKNAGFQPEVTQLPVLTYSQGQSYNENDLAAYLGIPIGVDMSKTGVNISSLPFKAYIQIWNDWYRDENLQSEIDNTNNNNNDKNLTVSNYWNQDYNLSLQVGKGLAPVSRLPDYFSTCLPWTQKGNPIDIFTGYGIDLSKIGLATQFKTGANTNAVQNLPSNWTGSFPNPFLPLDLVTIGNVNGFYSWNNSVFKNAYSDLNLKIGYGNNSLNSNNLTGYYLGSYGDSGNFVPTYSKSQQSFDLANGYRDANTPYTTGGFQVPLWRVGMFSSDPTNPRIAPLSGIGGSNNVGFTINDLRGLIALQHFQELDARGGTRYVELLRSHFGVKAPDDILYRSQYIGGFRSDISIDNVIQSSQGDSNSPLGSIGGYSVSGINKNGLITYSAKVHGHIIGLCCVRPVVSYSQTLPKLFTRTEKFDFYFPDFANIGEQPVKNYELYLSENPQSNNSTFGFQEAWATYRYSFNKLTGYMSVNSSLSMSNLYSYVEKYTSTPVLNGEWMKSNPSIISSTLMLNSQQLEFINDFLADFYFNVYATRPLPVQSIPGMNRI